MPRPFHAGERQENLPAHVPGYCFRPNANDDKSTRVDISADIPSQVSTHPLLDTVLLQRVHEAVEIDVDFKGVEIGELRVVHSKLGRCLAGYVPADALTQRIRRGLSDFNSLLNGYRKMLAVQTITVGPNRAGSYTVKDHSDKLTRWFVDLLWHHMFVAVSVSKGRALSRSKRSSDGPDIVLWHLGARENLQISAERNRLLESELRIKNANLLAIADAEAICTPPAPAAAPAAVPAAGSGVAAADGDEYSPRLLALDVCTMMTDLSCTPVHRIQNVRRRCAEVMHRALAAAEAAPEAPLGETVRACVAAFLFSVVVECPQRCAEYPFHVPNVNLAVGEGADEAATVVPAARKGLVAARKDRARHTGLSNPKSILCLMNLALDLLSTSSKNMQLNHNNKLSLWGATVHHYSATSLNSVAPVLGKHWRLSGERWEAVGSDRTRAVQFRLPPKVEPIRARIPGAKNEHKNEPVLPVFYSMASLHGVLEFFTVPHTDRLDEDDDDTVHFVARRFGVKKDRNPKQSTVERVLCSAREREQRALESKDDDYVGKYVPCVSHLDMHARVTTDPVESQSMVHVTHILEAEWMLICSWADANHFHSSATRVERKEVNVRKQVASAATAAAVAVAVAGAAPADAAAAPDTGNHLRRRINHTGERLTNKLITAMFHQDLRGNAISRWNVVEANGAALRLAECLACRMAARPGLRHHDVDVPVLLALTRQLRRYLVFWLHSATPRLPVNVYNAILYHNVCTQPAAASASPASLIATSPDALVLDLAMAQQSLKTRVCGARRAAGEFRPRHEHMKETRDIAMRGHVLRHLAALGLMKNAKERDDLFTSPEWHTLFARALDRSFPTVVSVVGPSAREQLVLFKYMNPHADVRFRPPVNLPRGPAVLNAVNRFKRHALVNLSNDNGVLQWALVPGGCLVDRDTARFRLNDVSSTLDSWDNGEQPTPFEQLLWRRHAIAKTMTIATTVTQLFESLLLLLLVLRDETFAYNVLLTLFVRQHDHWADAAGAERPTLDALCQLYERRLDASRMHAFRRAKQCCDSNPLARKLVCALLADDGPTAAAHCQALGTELDAVYLAHLFALCIEDKTAPLKLCDGFFETSIRSVFTTSLNMIGDLAWDTAERMGVCGALLLADSKHIKIPGAVRDTFRVLLSLPNAAARTAHISDRERAQLQSLLRV